MYMRAHTLVPVEHKYACSPLFFPQPPPVVIHDSNQVEPPPALVSLSVALLEVEFVCSWNQGSTNFLESGKHHNIPGT
jgi:hypothetical protein